MMSWRCPRIDTLSGILAVIVFLCAVFPAASFGAWRPQRPRDAGTRVRLVTAGRAEQGQPLRGIWTVLAPGDSVAFSLPGEGEVRLETRPLYPAGSEDDRFRLQLQIGSEQRLVRRRAPWEYDVTMVEEGTGASRAVVGVGEVDRLEFSWPESAGRLLVVNRGVNERDLLCRVLWNGPEQVPEAVGEGGGRRAESSLELEAGAPRIGWDSNAYLTAKTGGPKDSKWFLPLDLGARFTRDLSDRSTLVADYVFSGSFYDEPVLDESRHRLQLQGETRIGGDGPRDGTELALAYRFVHKNDTYNARGDRDEFETLDPVTGAPVPLGDRFDYNEHRFRATAGRRFGRDVTGALVVTNRYRDYVHDYNNFADIYSLDQGQWEIEGGVSWRIRPVLEVTGSMTWAHRDYEEKFAREMDGTELPTTPTSLEFTDLDLLIEYGRGPGLRAHLEVKAFSSSDLYAGYWDYTGTALEVGGGWRWSAGHRAEIRLRYSQKDYDNAHVDNDPAAPLREKNYLNLHLRGDYSLGEHWEAIGRYHFKDADNNNQPFAYTRSEIIVGMTYFR